MHGNRRSAPSPNPRVKARPFSKRLHPLLIASSLSAVCIALALPYSPVASWLGFVPIPATLLALMLVVIVYFLAVYVAKSWVFARHQLG
jgi:Mg2+-importing ATPase